MDNVQLSNQAKKWLKMAYKNSARQSAKIVRKAARSLAQNVEVKKELQYGRVDGLLVLHYAIMNGHKLLFTLLLEEFHIDPNLQDSFNGTTAVHHAATTGDNQMLETLLNTYLCDIEAHDHGNSTPVCYSIAFAKNSSLRKLLKRHASIDVVTFLGMPVHYAIHAGNFDAVRMLHESNPDVVSAEVYEFCTPLVAAAFCDSDDCFSYLTKAADISAKPLMYKIICCADNEERSLKRVKILLGLGANPNLFDQDILREELPIVCAAKRGFGKVVGALLDHTSKIPGVHWSVPGMLDYVKSDQYKDMSRVERESRVDFLKQRLIEELEVNHFLAADLICKALYVDMDKEQWDRYHSLCSLLITHGKSSIFMSVNPETMKYIGMMRMDENDQAGALQAAKACMALDPERDLCIDFYREVMGDQNNA